MIKDFIEVSDENGGYLGPKEGWGNIRKALLSLPKEEYEIVIKALDPLFLEACGIKNENN